MANALWKGSINFALLSVPVRVHTGVRPKDVTFNRIERSTGQRIKQRVVSSVTGEEVASAELAKGYDLGGGQIVQVTDDELAALTPTGGNGRPIGIVEFVELAQVDPIYFEKTYWLSPDKAGGRAYELLYEAMMRAGKAALARVVFTSKEHLVLIRPLNGWLSMTTLFYHDELVAPEAWDREPLAGPTADREVELTAALIDTFTVPCDLSKYEDTYRAKVLALVEAKAAGQAVPAPAAAPSQDPGSLMDVLQASLEAVTAAKAAHPSNPTPAKEVTKPKPKAKTKRNLQIVA